MESKDGSQSMKKDGGVDIYITYIYVYILQLACIYLLMSYSHEGHEGFWYILSQSQGPKIHGGSFS